MTNLLESVAAVLRETATEIILPRFKSLTAEQIQEKSSPGDLVTVADIEAEDKISNALQIIDMLFPIIQKQANMEYESINSEQLSP